RRHVHILSIYLRLPGSIRLNAAGDTVSNAEQPTTDSLMTADGAGAAHQGQKGRLNRIVYILRARQQTPTDPEDHRRMAIQQQFEGCFVPRAYPSAEEFRVDGRAGVWRTHGPPQVFEDSAKGSVAHARCVPPNVIVR